MNIRKSMIRLATAAAVLSGLFTGGAFSSEGVVGLAAEDALKRLVTGNARFVSGKSVRPNQSAERREETAAGQKPFAIILTCSDSRVPPEVIFDRGIGDIFIIRTAGNVVDDIAIGSIEYAVEHLGVKLVVVLGHKKCGAVDATTKGGEAPGHIGSIVDKIKPAVAKAKNKGGNLLDESIKENMKMIVEELKESRPILSEFVEKHELKIVGGIYDISSGSVKFAE